MIERPSYWKTYCGLVDMRVICLALTLLAFGQSAEAKHHRNQAARVEFQHIEPPWLRH